VLVVLSAAYFFSSTPATTVKEKLDEHVLAGFTSTRSRRSFVARKDGAR